MTEPKIKKCIICKENLNENHYTLSMVSTTGKGLSVNFCEHHSEQMLYVSADWNFILAGMLKQEGGYSEEISDCKRIGKQLRKNEEEIIEFVRDFKF